MTAVAGQSRIRLLGDDLLAVVEKAAVGPADGLIQTPRRIVEIARAARARLSREDSPQILMLLFSAVGPDTDGVLNSSSYEPQSKYKSRINYS